MIKIILAEDHHIVRKGIRLFLSEDPEIEIAAEASDGAQVLEEINKYPDVQVVMLDLNMPVMDGHILIPELKAQYPNVKVIVLSMVDDYNVIAELMGKGASGYLFKSSEVSELIFAIKFVAGGGSYICSALGMGLLENLRKNNAKVHSRSRSDFSDRELEILQLIAEGLTNNEIAEKLFVSKRTVEGHRQSLLEKTGSRNTAMLIRTAALAQLI